MHKNFTCSIIFTLLSVMIFTASTAQTLKWSYFVNNTATLSSPRAADLNNDGVLDIVIAGGKDGFATTNGIMAINGATGAQLWVASCSNEMYGSAVFLDINSDNIPDVIIAGRSNQMYALNGATGVEIWHYITPATDTILNIYNPQIIPDQNNDGIKDLLISNGGQHSKTATDQNRRPGMLKIVSSKDGVILNSAFVPDSKETYCSPLLVDFFHDSNYWIVYGTGGENASGSLWAVQLADLKNNDLTGSSKLATGNGKGFIAPQSLADLNHDGVLDIVAQCFDGTVYAVDFKNNTTLWKVNLGASESSTECTLGNFTGDLTPDVFALVNKGTYPNYTQHTNIMIDGATGKYKVYNVSDFSFASSSAVDLNADGRDEVLTSLNNIVNASGTSYYKNTVKVFNFQDSSITDLFTPLGGVNLASTPLITDLDNDKKIDVVFAFRKDSSMMDASKGIILKRIALNSHVPATGIAWGTYMGNAFDGEYTNMRKFCSGPRFIHKDSIRDGECRTIADGKLYISVTNGKLPYTYLWSNGAVTQDLLTAFPGKTYTVTVVDSNACMDTAIFKIADPYYISIITTPNNCPDETNGKINIYDAFTCMCSYSTCKTMFTKNGVSAGSITNTGMLTNLQSGVYKYTYTSTYGCVIKDSVIIAPLPFTVNVSATQESPLGSHNATATCVVSGGTQPYTIQWNDPAQQTTATANNLIQGNSYTVTVKDKNNCQSSAQVTIGAVATGLISRSYSNTMKGVSAFPNPAVNELTIEVDKSMITSYDLAIYDFTGKTVREYHNIDVDRLPVEKENLKSGLYQAVLKYPNGSSTFKIVFME